MASIVMTFTEWSAVAHELSGVQGEAAPAGLRERIQHLLRAAPSRWPDQPYALELDDASIEAAWRVHAAITMRDPNDGRRHAAVAEAVRIIHDHQC